MGSRISQLRNHQQQQQDTTAAENHQSPACCNNTITSDKLNGAPIFDSNGNLNNNFDHDQVGADIDNIKDALRQQQANIVNNSQQQQEEAQQQQQQSSINGSTDITSQATNNNNSSATLGRNDKSSKSSSKFSTLQRQASHVQALAQRIRRSSSFRAPTSKLRSLLPSFVSGKRKVS